MRDDPLMALIRSVLDAAGADVTASTTIEPRIREQWGGERYYFSRHPSVEKKTQWLGDAIASGTGVLDAAAAYGIPRRTAFRLVSRRWVPR